MRIFLAETKSRTEMASVETIIRSFLLMFKSMAYHTRKLIFVN